MADGRMLKKKISVNSTLAHLQGPGFKCPHCQGEIKGDFAADSTRLLFTWLLPHLDIEGRIFGYPGAVKGAAVPLLDHLDIPTVKACLDELQAAKLINVYESDGKVCIEYPKFTENQTLRRDKEAPSKLPPPPKQKTITTRKQKTENSRTTPGPTPGALPELLPENSGNKLYLREEKRSLREEKRRETTNLNSATYPPPCGKVEKSGDGSLSFSEEEKSDDFKSHDQSTRQTEIADTTLPPPPEPDELDDLIATLDQQPAPPAKPAEPPAPAKPKPEPAKRKASNGNGAGTVILNPHTSGFKTLAAPDTQDTPEPNSPLSSANPWRAFGLNEALRDAHESFTLEGQRYLTHLVVNTGQVTTLQAADALINHCVERKITYPPGLLLRVKEMKSAK